MLKDDNYTNPQVVIIDLGLSQAFMVGGGGPCGTPGYIPPETWRSGKWFPRGDMFSFGVTCLQLLTEKIPDEPEHDTGKRGIFTEGVASMDQIIMATETRLPPFHLMQIQSPALQQWLQICLDKRMHARQRAPQILNHPWFTGASDVGTHVESNRSRPASPSQSYAVPAGVAQVAQVGTHVEPTRSGPPSPRQSYTVPVGVAQLPKACVWQKGPTLPASPAIAQPARVANPGVLHASPEIGNPLVGRAPVVFGAPRSPSPAACQPLVATPARYAATAIRSPMVGSPVVGSPVVGRSPTRFR